MLDPAIRGPEQWSGGAVGVALRSLVWLLLGGWIGSWACFGLVVAPIAFAKLPSTEVAGQLIGPVLSALHLYGAVAGSALALLAGMLGRGRLRVALPLLMATACVYTQFGVSAEIAEIRDQVFGPQGSEMLAARWADLHRRSVGIFLAVSAGALWLLVLHARSDSRGAG
jgi:hypothetical protein